MVTLPRPDRADLSKLDRGIIWPKALKRVDIHPLDMKRDLLDPVLALIVLLISC
jgi:hypothetical protein